MISSNNLNEWIMNKTWQKKGRSGCAARACACLAVTLPPRKTIKIRPYPFWDCSPILGTSYSEFARFDSQNETAAIKGLRFHIFRATSSPVSVTRRTNMKLSPRVVGCYPYARKRAHKVLESASQAVLGRMQLTWPNISRFASRLELL